MSAPGRSAVTAKCEIEEASRVVSSVTGPACDTAPEKVRARCVTVDGFCSIAPDRVNRHTTDPSGNPTRPSGSSSGTSDRPERR